MRAKGGTESVHSFVTFDMWKDSLRCTYPRPEITINHLIQPRTHLLIALIQRFCFEQYQRYSVPLKLFLIRISVFHITACQPPSSAVEGWRPTELFRQMQNIILICSQ